MIPLNVLSKLAIRPHLAVVTRSLATSGVFWKHEESPEKLKDSHGKKEKLCKGSKSYTKDGSNESKDRIEDESDEGQEAKQTSQKDISTCSPLDQDIKYPKRRKESSCNYMTDQSKTKESAKRFENRTSDDETDGGQEEKRNSDKELSTCTPLSKKSKYPETGKDDQNMSKKSKINDSASTSENKGKGCACPPYASLKLVDDTAKLQKGEAERVNNSNTESTRESIISLRKEECPKVRNEYRKGQNDRCVPEESPKETCPPVDKCEDDKLKKENDSCEQIQSAQKLKCSNHKEECAKGIILVCYTQGEHSKKKLLQTEECSEKSITENDTCDKQISDENTNKTICSTDEEKEQTDVQCEPIGRAKKDSACLNMKNQKMDDPCRNESSRKNICEVKVEECPQSNKCEIKVEECPQSNKCEVKVEECPQSNKCEVNDPCKKDKSPNKEICQVESECVEGKTDECPQETKKECAPRNIPPIPPCCSIESAKECVCKLKELQKQWEEIIAFHESRTQNTCPESPPPTPKCQPQQTQQMCRKGNSNMIYVIIGAVLSAVIYYTYNGGLEPEELFLEEYQVKEDEDTVESE